MEERSTKAIGEHIRQRRKELGWTQQDLAEKHKVTKMTIIRYERGESLDNRTKVSQLEETLQMPQGALLGLESNTVPLVGYVGAGAEIIPVDDHEKGASLEEIEAPQGLNLYGYVAVRVRGDSMYPRYFEGEVIAFKRNTDWSPDCLNKECVVKLKDGRCFVKIVRAGSKDGLFTLESFNAPPIRDVQIEWACCKLVRL